MQRGIQLGHKGWLTLSCLRAASGPLAGYGISSWLAENVPSCHDLDRSMVRQELKRLQSKGLIEPAGEEQGRRGGLRKLFTLSEGGHEALEASLRHLIAAGGLDGDHSLDPIVRFADMCWAVETHRGTEAVAHMIDRRIELLQRRRKRHRSAGSASPENTYGPWATRIARAVHWSIEEEVQTLREWRGELAGEKPKQDYRFYRIGADATRDFEDVAE